MRSAVDLPQPDGPTSTRNSPSAMSMFNSVTATKPFGYFLRQPVEGDRCHETPSCRAGEPGWPRLLRVRRSAECLPMSSRRGRIRAVSARDLAAETDEPFQADPHAERCPPACRPGPGIPPVRNAALGRAGRRSHHLPRPAANQITCGCCGTGCPSSGRASTTWCWWRPTALPPIRTASRHRSTTPAPIYIHHPIHEARPDIGAAAHTHTQWGTPFSAERRMIEPINQEATCFFEDHVALRRRRGADPVDRRRQAHRCVAGRLPHGQSWPTTGC